jgi:hypothetical protein
MLLACCGSTTLISGIAKAQDLTPPPPEGTTCSTNRNSTVCRGTLDSTFDFKAEFTCDIGTSHFDINESGVTHRKITARYNREGLETSRTVQILRLAGTFSNAETGKSIPERGSFIITHKLLIPGDDSSDQETIAGNFAIATAPGGKIVLLDVGKIAFDPDGNIISESGKHQYLNSEIDSLCAALA